MIESQFALVDEIKIKNKDNIKIKNVYNFLFVPIVSK
jgi:hypothetical protein